MDQRNFELDRKIKKKIYDKAISIRCIEQRLLSGYSKRDFGGTVHTALGQEIIPSMISEALNDSYVISNHRGHGHFVAHTNNVEGLFSEFLSRSGAVSGGLGGSQHLKGENFLSNGIQGNTSCLVAGLSMTKVVTYYLGDGTFGEGALYEAMNHIATHNLPVLFVVEDNGIAQTTPQDKVRAGSIIGRFNALGIQAHEFDFLNNQNAINECFQAAFDWSQQGPLGIIAKVPRLYSHSKGDDTRPDETLEYLKKHDPLTFLAHSLGTNLEDDLSRKMVHVKRIYDDVFTKSKLNQSLIISHTENTSANYCIEEIDGDARMNQRINAAIHQHLKHKTGSMFIGEDIVSKWSNKDKPYAGAFGVASGLSEKFPQQVIGTSISEQLIIGCAIGNALATNCLSICEIMFADFLTLCVDQIFNGLDKYKTMYGCNLSLPVIIRAPYGAGRGYGPTHSQTPIELFSNLQNTAVLTPSLLSNFNQIFDHVHLSGNPAIIFEPKLDYGKKLNTITRQLQDIAMSSHFNGFDFDHLFYFENAIPEALIFCHGSTVSISLETQQNMYSEGVVVAVCVISKLYENRNMDSFLNAIRTPVVVFEEKNSAYGALEQTVLRYASRLNHHVKIHTNDHMGIVPSSMSMETEILPSSEQLVECIVGVIR